MDRLINNLRVLWRTERAIADIKLRHALARSGLNVAAAVLALVGFLMFEVAAFYALRDLWNTIIAALILGAANFIIAGILLLIANGKKPGRELDLANEINRNTMDALQADARLLQADVQAFGQALKHPLDGAAALIVPLATMLMNAMKKKTEPK
ncbi:MAG: phage holin family protein [Pseudorhodoplanes sp.]